MAENNENTLQILYGIRVNSVIISGVSISVDLKQGDGSSSDVDARCKTQRERGCQLLKVSVIELTLSFNFKYRKE